MKFKVNLSKLRCAAGMVLCFACAASIQAQDAPQPQPAPGLTQQKPATAPTKAQPPASSAGAAGSLPAPQTETQVVPAAAERHFHQGVQFERDGNTENAIEEYKAAIKEYPDYFKAHANLGRIYLDRKGYSEAIAQLKTAVSLQPDNADVHNNLGLALKRNRRSKRSDIAVSGSRATESQDGRRSEQPG